MRWIVAGTVSGILGVLLLARHAAQAGFYGGPVPDDTMQLVWDILAASIPLLIAAFPNLRPLVAHFTEAAAVLRRVADLLEQLQQELAEARRERAELRARLNQ